MLAYVWEEPTTDDRSTVKKHTFKAWLLIGGYAQVITIPRNVKYADLFLELQREAREAEKGLWGTAAASEPTANIVGNSRTKKLYLPDCQWRRG
ncbi:MAG: hypothetical protein C4575_02680 [Desulforudis sp.]|nr:MAG: hypothetical protein C4575_02680 [Desulforudis sp.]